ELLRDLSVRRRPHELALEDGDRALDLPGPRPDGTWHPVERPQLVDDRAADPGHGERLELDLAVGVEPLDRPDQTEQAVRDEVLLVDVGGEARADAAGDELDERRVREDETVAEPLVSRLPVVVPERLSVGRRHDRENTPGRGGFLSVVVGARSGRGCPSRARATPLRER